VNGARLRRRLEGLSEFGRPPGGTFADGVSRTAYSDADVAGRRYTMGLMREAGLQPAIDPAGNIFGQRPGTDAARKPILFGSHIDSVKGGGNFDGDVGSLSAVEVAQTLDERKIMTRHPLQVVIWAAEESNYGGGLSGSRAVAGLLEPGELDRIQEGVVKRDAVRKVGGDPDRYAEAQRVPGWFRCYLELHIEQGGKLDKAGIDIGVVEGIVSIDDYDVIIRGFANHAGTTPMNERKDALLAAAELVLAVREIVTGEPGAQVGTVGEMHVEPGAPNVVPGVVKHTIDLRDLSSEKIARIAERIRVRADEIARATGTEIEMVKTSHHEGANADSAIQQVIAAAADGLGLRHTRLPSGAGHDAQSMARLGAMGMIFVPSVGGISHSPRELTSWDDVENGANVLLHTILALDAQP
jgi:N-carbamoyl-L-amino-acid hydrolase